MKPTLSTTSVAFVALFGLAGCKGGGSADAIKLVPEQATIVGGLDVKGLMDSKLYTDNKDRLENAESKEMMEAAKACNVPVENWKSVTFGANPETEGVVAILHATGIGKEANLTCIHDKIKETDGKAPWTVEETDGKKTLKMDDDGVGYIVSDDMVAMASSAWSAEVAKLIKGEGKSATEGGLKDLYARAPTKKHIWFAGKIPTDAAARLKGTPGEQVQDFSGGIDLSNGLAVDVSAGVGSAENATTLQGELQKQFDQFKGMGAAMGVPQTVIDSVKIGTTDAAVSVAMSATQDDLKSIQEKLAPMLGGAMGGGAPPPGAAGMPPGAAGMPPGAAGMPPGVGAGMPMEDGGMPPADPAAAPGEEPPAEGEGEAEAPAE